VFGPDRPSFIDQVIARARERAEIAAVADKFSTPTYTLDLARWLRTAWEKNISGLLHLTNHGECSWQKYAEHALDCCRKAGIELKAPFVAPIQLAEMKDFVARRPVYTVLSTAKFERLTGAQPRSWHEAVAEYVNAYIAEK
jgi:dTDP-4-dehydrorhamnose reductase